MTLRNNEALLEAINDQTPVSGMSHTFYKYPARFSPIFAREVIKRLTRPGDLVLDPFVGGGTSLVEALACGRHGIGLDINELAIFVSRVKTTRFSDLQLRRAGECISDLAKIPLRPDAGTCDRDYQTYSLNMGESSTWRVRNFLALCLERLQQLQLGIEKNLIRCILLRTAQWGLDCRKQIPSLAAFRERLVLHAAEAIEGAKGFREIVVGHRDRPYATCFLRSAIGADTDQRIRRTGSPALVLTSPPYPRVHVLYHRWQIHGRRETAAPYWIANLDDGQGASYYTFADRNRSDLTKYLESAKQAFTSVRQLVTTGTPLAQMVAFSDPETQLTQYLKMLRQAGWSEMKMGSSRVWRAVPGRKWYTSLVTTRANQEIALFHLAD